MRAPGYKCLEEVVPMCELGFDDKGPRSSIGPWTSHLPLAVESPPLFPGSPRDGGLFSLFLSHSFLPLQSLSYTTYINGGTSSKTSLLWGGSNGHHWRTGASSPWNHPNTREGRARRKPKLNEHCRLSFCQLSGTWPTSTWVLWMEAILLIFFLNHHKYKVDLLTYRATLVYAFPRQSQGLGRLQPSTTHKRALKKWLWFWWMVEAC